MKRTQLQKEQYFIHAAKLLRGYGEVELSGPGITDQVLTAVSLTNSGHISKVKIDAPTQLSDLALSFFIQCNPQLHSLALHHVTTPVIAQNKPLEGAYLPLFLSNPQVKELHLHLVQPTTLNLATPTMRAALVNLKPLQHLTSITLWKSGLDKQPQTVAMLLRMAPMLRDLSISGSAEVLREAVKSCPELTSLSYYVESNNELELSIADVDFNLSELYRLKSLELVVARDLLISHLFLRTIGLLSIEELCLVSESFRAHPNVNVRSMATHVDGEGIRCMVDAFCERYAEDPQSHKPIRLSLIGACSLGHDSVSSLLRLPLLTGLIITGCNKISAMDKMRLVAKVKAGREYLEAQGIPVVRAQMKLDQTEFSIPSFRE